MEENKKIQPDHRVEVEGLDDVIGGIQARGVRMMPCSTPGCGNQIPEGAVPAYCSTCQERLRKEGVAFLV